MEDDYDELTWERVCAHNSVYQYTADSLRSAGLLTVCRPVQRDLPFAVWNADIGIMLDQEANVLWSVIKCRPVESGLLYREKVKREIWKGRDKDDGGGFKTHGGPLWHAGNMSAPCCTQVILKIQQWDCNPDTRVHDGYWAILRFAETTVIWHDDAYWIITKVTTDVRHTSAPTNRGDCVCVSVVFSRTQYKATDC